MTGTRFDLTGDVERSARARRWVELVALFVVAPALLALGPRWLVSVGILAGGIFAAVALRADVTSARGGFWGWAQARSGLRTVLGRAALVGMAMLAFVALRDPSALFRFPRARPVAWSLVMALYPLSAYAQELLYRTFFFHRYGRLFSGAKARVLASGALFGFAHVAVNSLAAVLLAGIVGVLFAATYERSRSTALVTIEHALYGDLVFTIGLGEIFYSASRWVAASH